MKSACLSCNPLPLTWSGLQYYTETGHVRCCRRKKKKKTSERGKKSSVKAAGWEGREIKGRGVLASRAFNGLFISRWLPLPLCSPCSTSRAERDAWCERVTSLQIIIYPQTKVQKQVFQYSASKIKLCIHLRLQLSKLRLSFLFFLRVILSIPMTFKCKRICLLMTKNLFAIISSDSSHFISKSAVEATFKFLITLIKCN